MHSAPVPTNVRYASNSDRSRHESEMTLSANSRHCADRPIACCFSFMLRFLPPPPGPPFCRWPASVVAAAARRLSDPAGAVADREPSAPVSIERIPSLVIHGLGIGDQDTDRRSAGGCGGHDAVLGVAGRDAVGDGHVDPSGAMAAVHGDAELVALGDDTVERDLGAAARLRVDPDAGAATAGAASPPRCR